MSEDWRISGTKFDLGWRLYADKVESNSIHWKFNADNLYAWRITLWSLDIYIYIYATIYGALFGYPRNDIWFEILCTVVGIYKVHDINRLLVFPHFYPNRTDI